MSSSVKSLLSSALLATFIATIPGASTAQTAPKKSIWQQMKDAAKQPGQPAGQPAQQPQSPGQRPAKPGQPAPPGAAQVNDTGPFTPPPGTKIDPVVMAPIEQGAAVAVSPHGIHVATLSHSGSRAVITYDGVTGPKFDQLFMEGGGGANPVVFSPDGNRWAYCGQQGEEWVVIVDGNELARGKPGSTGQMNALDCTLGFTSNSKHVYFTSFADAGAVTTFARFVFDGKPGPLGADTDLRNYAFSPDGNHYAYICYEPVPNSQRSRLIVDNQPVPYDAGSPQWSADSQHLYTMRVVRVADPRIGSAQEFLLDGKPFLRADNARLFIPPEGNMVVAIVSRQHVSPQIEFLVVGGKEVPGSEVAGGGISGVTFSPDGKHYAASFHNANNRQYVISDGKKGLEYPSVTSLAYTADSSKLFYQAYDTSSGARYFVIGGEESERIPSWDETVFAPIGGHVVTSGNGFFTLDGKIIKLPAAQATAISFSPDASHFALVLHDRGGMILYVDGAAQTSFGPINGGPLNNISTRPYIFSPDSKHVAYFCRSTNSAAGNDIYLCLDDKAVRLGASGYYANLTFSGDSSHLMWTKNKPQGEIRIFVDGQPVQDGFPMSTGGFQKETWQIGPDGNLLVLLEDGDSLKRIRITPSPDTSLATVVGSGTTQANGN